MESKKFKVTLSPKPLTEKPKIPKDVIAENNRINSANTIETDMDALGKAIINGHSFCHCVFSGSRSNENFVSSELIVLDIDNTKPDYPLLTLGSALNRLKGYGLECNMAYTSYGDEIPKGNTHPNILRDAKRFRLIFRLPRLITDISIYNDVLKKVFYQIFPEADKCPAVQLWYGGKNLLPINMNYELDIERLCFMAATTVPANYSTRKAISHHFKQISAIPNVLMERGNVGDGTDGSDDPNTARVFSIYKARAENASFPPIRNFDWAFACSEFQLLDDFINCKRKIIHDELFGLYLAMQKIEGGKTKWKECIENNKLIKDSKVKDIASYLDNRIKSTYNGLFETKIFTYAPKDKAAIKYNYLYEISNKLSPYILEDTSYQYCMPLSDAHRAFNRSFHEAIMDNGNGKYVFNCATGLGKSEAIVKCKHLEETLIAVPTHELKNELSKRLTLKGVEHYVLPELPVLPFEINSRYEFLNSIGANNMASRYLKEIINSTKFNVPHGVSESEFRELREELKSYFVELENCQKTTMPVLLTHKKLFTMDFLNHTSIIIDEDIISALWEIKQTTTKDFRMLLNRIEVDPSIMEDDVAVLRNFIALMDSDYLMKVTSTHTVMNKLSDNFRTKLETMICNMALPFDGSLIGFFTSDNFFVDITDRKNDPKGERTVTYMKKNTLPLDKKIILLSATANEDIYNRIFDSLEWFDFTNVTHVGELMQIYNLSISRSWMSKKENSETINRIKALIGDKPVITYKKYSKIFRNPTHFSIESCEGYDTLNGKDIIVVGTPHIPLATYVLYAYAMGHNIPSDEIKMDLLRCEYKGIRFNFMTFKNSVLQRIQFHIIESTLIQAYGRARTIRKNCQVVLFSNFPLVGFEKLTLKQYESRVSGSPEMIIELNSTYISSSTYIPSGSHGMSIELNSLHYGSANSMPSGSFAA